MVSDENTGLVNALNTLIDLIMFDGSYDYIARMDSDDICYPNRINKQVLFF